MKKTAVINFSLLITMLFSCLKANANEANFDNLTSFHHTGYHKLHAKQIDHDYHIYVNLPEKYHENPSKKYPTIYLLDGGITFPLMVGYYQYLHLGEELPEMIIVGISYGTNDYKKGNRRSTDFTAPSKEREYYGGAKAFQNMLSNELFKTIETTYRSDPDKRILFGQSIGGQFVIYDAMTNTTNFWGHIASNPAIHRNLDYYLTLENQANKKTQLYVASAEHDEERFKKPFQQWKKHWKSYKQWQLKIETIPGHNHFSAAPISFRNGLKWLFKNDK